MADERRTYEKETGGNKKWTESPAELLCSLNTFLVVIVALSVSDNRAGQWAYVAREQCKLRLN